MKRDQAGKDFHVLHKTRHQNTACLHNSSLHETADFPPLRGTLWGGTVIDALALLTQCLLLQLCGTKRSAFTHSAHAEAFS